MLWQLKVTTTRFQIKYDAFVKQSKSAVKKMEIGRFISGK